MKLPPFFETGYSEEIGRHRFTSEEIIRFARKYDPQLFHIDPEAARKSVLGGLCASGWHTAAMWMRCLRDHARKRSERMAEEGYGQVVYGPSPGFEELKWLRPVYAGDVITYANKTLECRPSASRKGWYVYTGGASGTNQDGDLVITFKSSVLLQYPA